MNLGSLIDDLGFEILESGIKNQELRIKFFVYCLLLLVNCYLLTFRIKKDP